MSNTYNAVIETLRYNTSKVLEEFIKAYIEEKNYDSISVMAELGNKSEVFFNELQSQYTSNGTVAQSTSVKKKNVAKKSDKINTEQTLVSQQKLFILRFLAQSGGKAPCSQLTSAYEKHFKHTFTDEHYVLLGDGMNKWQHAFYNRISRMRLNKFITPFSRDVNYGYYELTVSGINAYKKNAVQIEKQLKLPDMFAEG
jgi:hypothetical protein